MLVTSRQPLHLRWEQEFPLLPLAVPDADEQTSTDAVGASPAVELLRRPRPPGPPALRARRRANVGGGRRDRPAARRAAARARAGRRPAPGAVSRPTCWTGSSAASTPRGFVAGHARAPPHAPRARSRGATTCCPTTEQRVFRRLGVFAGGAGLEAVEARVRRRRHRVGGRARPRRRAWSTSRWSVVTGGLGGRTRFRLLETIREYAVEQLVAAGEAEALWDRHLAWHVDLAEQAWEGFWSADMPAWLDVLEREHDNLRTALDHAAGAGAVTLGLRIARGAVAVLGRPRPATARASGPPGGAARRGLGPDAPRLRPGPERARVAGRADGRLRAGRRADGRGTARSCGRTARPTQLAWSLAEQGNVLFSLGDAEGAGSTFTEGLELARQKSRHLPHRLLPLRPGLRRAPRRRPRGHEGAPRRSRWS